MSIEERKRRGNVFSEFFFHSLSRVGKKTFFFFTHALLLLLNKLQQQNSYVEQYAADGKAAAELDAQEALGPIIKVALETSKLREFTGRDKPTVVT